MFFMKRSLIYIINLLLVLQIFTGCINERGFSYSYYEDCTEYYDAMGVYHKKCGENIVDYKDIRDGAKTIAGGLKTGLAFIAGSVSSELMKYFVDEIPENEVIYKDTQRYLSE